MPEMLLLFNMWENVMKHVDRSSSRVKRGLVDQEYCIPEPALLISGQTPECRKLFMANWLTICLLWISWLDYDPPT